ncbi:MAG: Vacuolar protein sorting-associated protein 5 [Vezdaea aestivalis]|nr:MAG: Vacuolar protein sorting-associated protein 5 [Vezdaea aestivalis]
MDDSPWGDEPRRESAAASTKSGENEPVLTTDTAASSDPASPPSSKPAPVRGTRAIRRVGAQPTRLEALDDSLGPLGPLGDSSEPSLPEIVDSPPVPPQKETPAKTGQQSGGPLPHSSEVRQQGGADYGDNLGHSQGGRSTLTQLQSGVPYPFRQIPPSVSVEQAAFPKFDITVGDPHKVGDLTSSHIVYQVRTKTTSKGYRQPEFAVSRRYKDFLWLYNALHNNNPGVVVPPPPEKQAVGRFDTDFVESRRAALERMLNKTASHPILHHDGDLKLFLESEAFNIDVRNREKKEPGIGESKSMFGSIGGAFSVSSSSKFIEHDDWFHEKRVYLDALENQLKALMKAVDTVINQRKELAAAAGEFSSSLQALSTVELAPTLSTPLGGLSDLQIRVKELYERQAQQDILTLGITIDEYIRLIGSIKQAFSQRQKAYHTWHSAESEMLKRKATQDKLSRQGKSQQDRLNQLSADVIDAERKVHQSRLTFENMGRLMRNELERFEKEKVEDFKSGVETFLESAMIELWETFLMQMDAEEDGESTFKPLGVVKAAPVSNTPEPPTPDPNTGVPDSLKDDDDD